MQQTQTEIFVPALMEGGNVIVPQARLGRTVEIYRLSSNGRPLTAVDYQKFNPPTLAVSRHAFFDKNPDGSFVSPEYRESVLSNRGRGEWTSTFLRDGREAVERPDRVFYHKKSRIWIAEGGKVSKVELQPCGWVLEYDGPTGFPSRTSPNKADAEKIFGGDASCFYPNENGLCSVLRYGLKLYSSGPFDIDAYNEPDSRHRDTGVRSLCRPEQDAGHPATPRYIVTSRGNIKRITMVDPDARRGFIRFH